MNKKLVILLSFFLIFLLTFVFKNYIIEASLYINKTVIDTKNEIEKKINMHFNQAKTIAALMKENKILKNKLENLMAKLKECEDLKYFNLINKPNLVFAYTISYASIPDFSQIYISYNKEIQKPKGLIYNNLVAGEVIKNIGNFSLAILNSNKKTRYAVYIGKNEIPGIFYGEINTIKYIPKFKQIYIGDEVITSGLDGIFYKGIKVGIITKVIEKKLYKEAKVKLFYNDLHPKYFYVIEGGKNAN